MRLIPFQKRIKIDCMKILVALVYWPRVLKVILIIKLIKMKNAMMNKNKIFLMVIKFKLRT